MESAKQRGAVLHQVTEKKWAVPLAVSSLVCVLLLVTSFNMGLLSSLYSRYTFSFNCASNPIPSLESRLSETVPPPPPPAADDDVPRLAYLIAGSKGDLEKLWRTLRAFYHPRNQYVIHMDLESPATERTELARRVEADPIFAEVGNVHMMTKANLVTYKGPTMVANTLHGGAVLLKRSKKWDWFINLSASDYPLVTQDDILHTFSLLPRNLNFVDHTSNLGRKVSRGQLMIVDPGLYMTQKKGIFFVKERRQLPTAFKLFTGSAWLALTRDFVEFCVWGWDNLPRTLLMYYTNFVSTPEGYFQTIICNVPEFAGTAVNHDLHYISWDPAASQHPLNLNITYFPKMVASNASFARKFRRDDPLLDKIDAELLGRANGSFVPGGWCAGTPPCSQVGNISRLVPGPGARRLAGLMDRIVRSKLFEQSQCK